MAAEMSTLRRRIACCSKTGVIIGNEGYNRWKYGKAGSSSDESGAIVPGPVIAALPAGQPSALHSRASLLTFEDAVSIGVRADKVAGLTSSRTHSRHRVHVVD